MKQFMEFAAAQLKEPMFEVDGTLTFKGKDITQAGGFIFDFVDLEEKFVLDDEDGRKNVVENDIIKTMKSLSMSMRELDFEKCVHRLKMALSEAHYKCKGFANTLTELSVETWLECFLEKRSAVVNRFVNNLTGANKRHLINNLDMQSFSIPMEYSLKNNLWCAQALYMQLDYFEKEEKFNQIMHMDSQILQQRRNYFLNQDV